jgi:hypothetical protein
MKADIAQALLQTQAQAPPIPAIPPSPVAQNPFVLDPALEAQAATQRPPMHPIVAAIMQRLGLLNMIRNQGNASIAGSDQQ